MGENKQLNLADAQFIGFIQGRYNPNIIDLVESMGLTKQEWEEWKKDYPNILNDNDFNEIEDHFK